MAERVGSPPRCRETLQVGSSNCMAAHKQTWCLRWPLSIECASHGERKLLYAVQLRDMRMSMVG